jgi:hypothetical protein
MQVQVQLFGAFRDLEPSGLCQIEFREGQTAEQIKLSIYEVICKENSKINFEALFKVSAIGSENKVFADDELVSGFTMLAILPPVCGG